MLVYNSSTTSKRSLWPPEKKDAWVVSVCDSQLYLNDSLYYDDWASALGANTLGYDRFNDYYYSFEPAASLPWNIEFDFANEFCQAMGTETVRFFKTGSDALSCAVRLARAYTGRKNIILFDKSYHGTASEFGPIIWNQGGYPRTPAKVLEFGCKLGGTILNQVAAIVVEPVPKAIEVPDTQWLVHLREVCDKHGIILISDEVILGYRHALSGYCRSVGVQPDLLCFGKAMGQGAAISACTGRLDIMKQLEDKVHFSGTNNGEPLPLWIAQATLKEYLEKNICVTLNVFGLYLQSKLINSGFEVRGLNSRFEVVFDSPEQRMSATRFLWDRQILFPGFCSMAVTHSVEQMQRLVEGLKCWREPLS